MGGESSRESRFGCPAVYAPSGVHSKAMALVLCESDEDAFNDAIAHLPEPVRRLKPIIGRKLLCVPDEVSVQASADHEHAMPDVLVVNGFLHYSESHDTRTAR